MSIPRGVKDLIILLVFLSFQAGCATEDADNNNGDTGSATEATKPMVTATITVPTDFGGQTTEGLAVSFWSSLPENLTTLPEGIGAFGESYILLEPEIDENNPLEIQVSPIALSNKEPIEGEYYINITLFVEGGGFAKQMPTIDVDYSHFITTTTAVGTTAVDLGEMDLRLFKELPSL